MTGPHFPAATDLPPGTLLFMDGPVWVGVRIEGVDGAAIMAAVLLLMPLVVPEASPTAERTPAASSVDSTACGSYSTIFAQIMSVGSAPVPVACRASAPSVLVSVALAASLYQP